MNNRNPVSVRPGQLQWVLAGRFAVQNVTFGTGGIYSVALRAVPIG
jgi:hypothetical protein